MKKILTLVALLALTIGAANAQKRSHWSIAVKGGVNHFYDNAPKGSKEFPFNFTGGLDVEYSFNRFLGLSVEYLYLDRDRDINAWANSSHSLYNLYAENHDFSGYLTFNLLNLLAPNRAGKVWNLYAKGGAGLATYHYSNHMTNLREKASKCGLVLPVALTSEFNVSREIAIFAEGQFRWYNKGNMAGFNNVTAKWSRAWAVMLGVRAKIKAKKYPHIKNYNKYVEPKPVVVTPAPAPQPKPQPKPEPKPEPKPQPKPEPKPEPKPVITQEEQKVITEAFQNLQFDTNKATIKAVSYPSLDKLAELLVRNPKATVKLSGYTDSTGSRAYNIGLSQRRADAVKTYLINKGVSASNIEAKGYGPDSPVASNATPSGRAQNRRTEILVTKY